MFFTAHKLEPFRDPVGVCSKRSRQQRLKLTTLNGFEITNQITHRSEIIDDQDCVIKAARFNRNNYYSYSMK